MGEQGTYVLRDLSRDPITGVSKGGVSNFRDWLGHAVVAMPLEGRKALDYTGPLGSVMGIYYSLVFQLGKWEYNLQKASEWVEVSPVHAQYYQLTHRQKEELEGKIKQGLQSVSQSVADMELLMHDIRRYVEFLHYMGYRSYKELNKTPDGNVDENEIFLEDNESDANKRVDNHSLKAVFVDQVDVHTGEGISMRSIVSRWPTLISDFMNMNDEDMDQDKTVKKLNVSRAEAIVLITKNKLYVEWKKIFVPEIKTRYRTIKELLQGRNESIRQYRDWLKPYVARHKLIEEGLGSAGGRGFATISPYTPSGTATSASQIVLYVWKDFLIPEIFKGGSEETGKLLQLDKIPVDDEWTKRNFIFGKEMGLINEFPWITEEWVTKQKNWMFNNRWLTKHKPYYSFFVITLDKSTIRMPTGEEIDDGVFDVNMIFMSQNAMFVKLLELRAKQQEMEDYIDGLLGVRKPVRGKKPFYAEEKKDFFSNMLGKASLDFILSKSGGPYERDFEDRITKGYLLRIAGDRYASILKLLEKKMGMGGGK